MMMSKGKMSVGPLIDDLVAGLSPVTPLRHRDGMLAIAGATLAVAMLVVFALGLRADLLAGTPHAMLLLRSGLLLLLGLTGSYAVVDMSRPAVGRSFRGWLFALAAALLLPLTAILMSVTGSPPNALAVHPHIGLSCTLTSLLAALLVAVVQVAWLRRGAPVMPERAGWLAGLSSGAIGTAAYGLHCTIDDIAHIGLYGGLAVLIAAMVGRLAVPPLIRW